MHLIQRRAFAAHDFYSPKTESTGATFFSQVLWLGMGVIFLTPLHAGFFLGAGSGWRQYEASQLNQFLDRTYARIQEGNGMGERVYNGSWAQQLEAGWRWDRYFISWKLGYWNEFFRDDDIPFSQSTESELSSCSGLGGLPADSNAVRGCATLHIRSHFIPMGFSLGGDVFRREKWRVPLELEGGLVLGSSEITLATDYEESVSWEDDAVTLKLASRLPWFTGLSTGLARRFGRQWEMGVRIGYLWFEIDSFKIGEQRGSSKAFDLLFDSPEPGDRFYLEAFPNQTQPGVLIGKEKDKAASSTLHLVEGNFSGWRLQWEVLYYMNL